MPHSASLPSSRPAEDLGRLFLTTAFFAFCYCLLTWRAMLLTEAAPLFSERRAIALLVGAAVFWMALGQLEKPGRMTLARTASWIVLGTIVVMVARLFVDWWKPDALLTVTYSLRWSLAWAAYFGLWLMGAAAFRRRAVVASSLSAARPAVPIASIEGEQVDWIADALAEELEGASAENRSQLAQRLICRAGAYELVEEGGQAASHNARVRLAYRIAARLIAPSRSAGQ